MARHYYGFYNAFGLGTRSTTGGRYGHLAIFDSKEERDTWEGEAEDYRSGNLHTEAISSKEAKLIMFYDLQDVMEPSDFHPSFWTWSDVYKYATTDELIKEYRSRVEEA